MAKEINAPLDKLAVKLYYEYGVATLEDRAIGDYRDGFMPVQRRVLYAAQELGLRHTAKLVKSARVVGDTLGKYHPHGDMSCYGAMVGMANKWMQAPLIDGHGNWGSITDPKYAAHRYTEARLTRFADEVLFNKFYFVPGVVDYIPNYDGSSKEPLILPALLPMVLINGQFGIATGATTNIPSFEFKSVLKALRAIYEGQEIEPKFLYKTLKVRSTFGGEERPPETKEQKQDRMAIFTTFKGKVTLWSNPVYDEKARTITATEFAFGNMEKKLEALLKIDGVAEARDDSNKSDKYGRLTVVLKRNLQTKAYAKLVKRIDAEMNASENFNQNLTERYIDEEGMGQARVRPMNVTTLLTEWVKWRTELERKACTYWISQDDKEIRRLELLILAVDNRKMIIESLDKDLDEKALYEWLAKKLKIKVDEAQFIYGLRVIQLRKLERKTLVAQMKEVLEHKKGLQSRHKKPEPHMAKQLESFVKLLGT